MYYIDYLDSTSNFQQKRKHFETNEEALAWMKENFEKWDIDWINKY